MVARVASLNLTWTKQSNESWSSSDDHKKWIAEIRKKLPPNGKKKVRAGKMRKAYFQMDQKRLLKMKNRCIVCKPNKSTAKIQNAIIEQEKSEINDK